MNNDDKYKAQKEYYRKHKDEIREYQKIYQKEYQRKWREQNREAFNLKHNKYYHEKVKRKKLKNTTFEKYKESIVVSL